MYPPRTFAIVEERDTRGNRNSPACSGRLKCARLFFVDLITERLLWRYTQTSVYLWLTMTRSMERHGQNDRIHVNDFFFPNNASRNHEEFGANHSPDSHTNAHNELGMRFRAFNIEACIFRRRYHDLTIIVHSDRTIHNHDDQRQFSKLSLRASGPLADRERFLSCQFMRGYIYIYPVSLRLIFEVSS